MLLDRPLSVLFVCLSCLQRWCIVAKGLDGSNETWHAGSFGPGHIVLDGDPAPIHQRRKAPNFRPISVVAKWLDGSRRHLVGGSHQSKRHCARWGPSSPPQKGDRATPIYGPCPLWPNGWMDRDGTWHVGRPQPRPHCARWGPNSPPQKRGHSPQFRPMSIVAKRLGASGYHLVWR